MSINRRAFLGTAAAGLAASKALAAPVALNNGKANVVVVGGGVGGATVARYLAKNNGDALNITLVEPTRTYYTCFFSNLYLGGFWEFEGLAHGYGELVSAGVNVVHDWAVGVDRDTKTVSLAGGAELPYDRLVLSPGIDFVDGAVPGWSTAAQNIMPHAYKAGSQTQLLKAQLEAMPEGGTFAMIAPPNPYRCPPGPYERVSMVAHKLKAENPTAKILVIDPKEKFSKQGLFEEGWNNHYSGMVERIGPDFGGDRVEVRPEAMEVVVDGEVNKVDVCNVIPAMKAGRICDMAGVTEGNWAPVEPTMLKSKIDENVHVLGDSCAQGDMPKSGFSANSQAKVVANAIGAELAGGRLFPAKFSNTCWSLIDTDDGVKVGATYEPGEGKIAKVDGFISQTGETADLRKQTYEESVGWYNGITADIFG